MGRIFRYSVLMLALGGFLSLAQAQAQFSLPGLSFGSSDSSEDSDGEKEQSEDTRDLGTAAVALVEEVRDAPDAGIEMMDYVFPKQTIALGDAGVVVLAHLDGCLVETITGGLVTVKRGGSAVEGGARETRRAACQVAKAVITDENREAGAVVNRVTLFDGADWSEQVIRTARPTFKWKGAKGESLVRVLDMDREDPEVIWRTRTMKSFVAYPQDAPPLKIGMPYRVEVEIEVEGEDDETHKALFSRDPDLEIADSFLTRVVTISR